MRTFPKKKCSISASDPPKFIFFKLGKPPYHNLHSVARTLNKA